VQQALREAGVAEALDARLDGVDECVGGDCRVPHDAEQLGARLSVALRLRLRLQPCDCALKDAELGERDRLALEEGAQPRPWQTAPLLLSRERLQVLAHKREARGAQARSLWAVERVTQLDDVEVRLGKQAVLAQEVGRELEQRAHFH